MASVWTINKGYDDFLKLRRLLDDEYVFCMVGLNNKQIKNLPKGIIGVKKTDSLQELAAYYSAADVFLNLTYEDTFPTTNIEALACGTPVITTQGTPWKELESNHCGWWTAIGTEATTKALKDFLQQTETQLEQMGRNGRKLVEEKYSSQKMAYDMVNLYRKILEQ